MPDKGDAKRKELRERYSQSLSEESKKRAGLRKQIETLHLANEKEKQGKTEVSDENPFLKRLKEEREKRKAKEEKSEDPEKEKEKEKEDDKESESMKELAEKLKERKRELPGEKEGNNKLKNRFDKLCEQSKVPKQNQELFFAMLSQRKVQEKDLEKEFNEVIGKYPILTKSTDLPSLTKGGDLEKEQEDFSNLSLEERKEVLTQKLMSGNFT